MPDSEMHPGPVRQNSLGKTEIRPPYFSRNGRDPLYRECVLEAHRYCQKRGIKPGSFVGFGDLRDRRIYMLHELKGIDNPKAVVYVCDKAGEQIYPGEFLTVPVADLVDIELADKIYADKLMQSQYENPN